MGRATDLHRRIHEVFNQRDWDAVRAMTADNTMYEDVPRGLALKSADELMDWLRGWSTGMSDAAVTEADYIDGGDYSVARFMGRGTNDGPLARRTRRAAAWDMPFCEILRWDEDGRSTEGAIYYDQITMLVQLGVMEPPPME